MHGQRTHTLLVVGQCGNAAAHAKVPQTNGGVLAGRDDLTREGVTKQTKKNKAKEFCELMRCEKHARFSVAINIPEGQRLAP